MRLPQLSRLHDYFLPHERNGWRPHVFAPASLAVIVMAFVALEGAYALDMRFVMPRSDFLAAVLPGALLTLTNADRAAAGAPALTESAALDQAATLAARDMAEKGYFAHVSPAGTTPWDWLAAAGYDYQYAGENLAVNFTDSDAVEEAWMASPTHHANIVKPQYTQVGFGTAEGVYEGKATTFVVTFFGTPEAIAASAPAPVEAAPPTAKAAAVAPQAVHAPTQASPADRAPSLAPASAPVEQERTPVPSAPTVLAANAPRPSASWLTRLLASPTTAIETTSTILLTLVIVLVGIAAVHMQVPRREVYAGGAFLLLLIVSGLFVNAELAGAPLLPSGAESASVAASSAP